MNTICQHFCFYFLSLFVHLSSLIHHRSSFILHPLTFELPAYCLLSIVVKRRSRFDGTAYFFQFPRPSSPITSPKLPCSSSPLHTTYRSPEKRGKLRVDPVRRDCLLPTVLLPCSSAPLLFPFSFILFPLSLSPSLIVSPSPLHPFSHAPPSTLLSHGLPCSPAHSLSAFHFSLPTIHIPTQSTSTLIIPSQ